MSHLYILDSAGEPKPEPDLHKWAAWYKKADRHVALTETTDGARVSTVFLGLDHNYGGGGPPILWETMVFDTDSPWQGYQKRYATREGALNGHWAIVRVINAGELPNRED